MRRDYSLYFFGFGLVFIVIQMLIIGFGYLNPDQLSNFEQFAIVEEMTFKTIVSDIWSGVTGTLLLMVLFVRRMLKGPEAMLVLVGVMLWVIQILNLRTPEMGLTDLALEYLMGVIGIVLTSISALYDTYIIKSTEGNSDDK